MNSKSLLTLHGWHLSYFAGKVRCYLKYKGIAFRDQPVSLWTLMGPVKRQFGTPVMPVLQTGEGEWIQDSSVIIDRLEALHPAPGIWPATPVQAFAASVMEAWADEWWIPVAMHTRWSYPGNYALFENEAGSALLPGFPSLIQRLAVASIAKKLRGYLHSVGVRPEQNALLDQWTRHMLDLLEAHFSEHDYLFGARPCIGDFALAGPMYGHLGRDPWPARELIAPRPHLRAWIDRMSDPKGFRSSDPRTASADSGSGLFLPDDHIPKTLEPVFKVIFAQFLPMLQAILSQVVGLKSTFPSGKPLPRRLDEVEIPVNGQTFKRSALPYTLWMAQRTLDVFSSMSVADQGQVRTWLGSLGGDAWLDLRIPRLQQIGVQVAFDSGV